MVMMMMIIIIIIIIIFNTQPAEAYLGPCQAPMTELFMKTVNGF